MLKLHQQNRRTLVLTPMDNPSHTGSTAAPPDASLGDTEVLLPPTNQAGLSHEAVSPRVASEVPTTPSSVAEDASASRGVPTRAWLQLGFAVLAISTAAVAFRFLPDTPPFLLASWRMQATSVILAAGAVYQARIESRALLRRWWRNMPLMVISGVCLGAHFGLWVWGLQNTSLAHSLLLVCCTPLLLSLGSLVLCIPVSTAEIGSSVLGAAGVGVMTADVGAVVKGQDDAVTWYGDVLSLGAAAAIVGYMLVGHRLRQWMPLFLYAFPVTFTAAVVLALASAAVEGAGADGIVGWVFNPRAFTVVAYLALGPGLVGHTGYNGVLRYISPLAVSVSLTMEPLFGSLLGWGLGVAAPPGWPTFAGGAMLTAAVVLVVVATKRREKQTNDNT